MSLRDLNNGKFAKVLHLYINGIVLFIWLPNCLLSQQSFGSNSDK
jgi:hypothetical protein